MNSNAVDLDAYFERIGYNGRKVADMQTLRALQFQHVTCIPFENLDPFLGRPVRLDPASLEQKLILEQRGGYCYEHNLLFGHVLEALGFEVTGLAARVMWNQPEGSVMARTHMLLGIELNDRFYIADAGFGALTLTVPVALQAGIVQQTTHEPVRLLRQREEFILQAEVRGAWKSLYRFELVEQLPVDYELSSWYLCNHPESVFVTGLMAARPAADCRYTLQNDQLSVHYADGRTERRSLGGTAAIQKTLTEIFAIQIPDDAGLENKLSGLFDDAA